MIKNPAAQHPDRRQGTRLTIELAVRSDLERFMRTAVRLAKFLGSELQVVSRQDTSVLQAAALPVVQEICLWTAREQQISTGTLSRSIRIQSRQAKIRLARIAEREAVSCSFVSSPEGEASAEESTPPPGSIRWIGGRGLSVQAESCPVCVLDSGDSTGQACMQQATRLAARAHRPLKVFTLRSQSGEKGKIRSVDQMLRHAHSLPCFALFIPESEYLKCRERKLLEQVPFPVLLV